MSIYKNALDAIICGIEDYTVGTDSRYKSALRNVYSGLLLLFKEKLRTIDSIHTEDLFAQKVVPKIEDGKLVWRASGKNTADTQIIRERFESLNIKVDWKTFDEISRIRNEIEHKYTNLNAEGVREFIVKSVFLITDFLSKNLNLNIKKELGDEIYTILIGISEVYEKEKNECSLSWQNFNSYSKVVNAEVDNFFCPGCASELVFISQNEGVECRACDEVFSKENFIESILKNKFATENYLAVSQGGDPAVVNCPECYFFTFVVDEMACASCGQTQDSECALCSNPIPVEEIDGTGYCSWCQHRMNKDD